MSFFYRDIYVNVSILGYKWGKEAAKYVVYHAPIMKLVGISMDITHLGIQCGDYVYHNLGNSKPNNRRAHWINRKVSDRLYGKPDAELCLGNSKESCDYARGLTADIRTPVVYQYLWFYSLGRIKLKKDCVWVSKLLISHLLPDLPPLKSQMPSSILKELKNHGY